MKNRKKAGVFNEMTGLITVALGLIVLLSLISYNPMGTNFLGDTADKDTNLIGKWGNRTADGLLNLLGYGAYIFVIILGYISFLSFSSRGRDFHWYAYPALVLFLISICALLSVVFPTASRVSSGGISGKFLAKHLIAKLNVLGSLILLITATFALLMVILRISPGSITKFIYERIKRLWNKIEVYINKKKIINRYPGGNDENIVRKGILLGKKPKTKIVISNGSLTGKENKNKRFSIGLRNTAGDTDSANPDVRVQNIRPESGIDSGEKDALYEPRILDEREQYRKHTGGIARRKKEYGWRLPSVNLLDFKPTITEIDERMLHRNTEDIINKFKEFRIEGAITQIHPGPVVTTYEFKPAPGIKYSKIVNLIDDLCLALKAENIRMARIPGKATIGIEVPNQSRQIIYLREIIDSEIFRSSRSKLTLALGKTMVGKTYLTDLARMPHLLMAGTTGSGKSVSINASICSILYNATPDEVKFIMIDPKRLELGIYEDIPHLLTPVVTDPRLAAAALMWAVHEMNERLEKLSKLSVRDIEQYNRLIRRKNPRAVRILGEDNLETLPYLVVVVDELSDLMIVASSKVEEAIIRLSQMARAVGIHLIVATQRPSVDVITGIIKANMPSRISFRVFSKVDSRTILDKQGAEKLLGRGDMLFIPPGSASQMRVHGALVTEDELEKVITFWKRQGRPMYDEQLEEQFEAVAEAAFKKKSRLTAFDLDSADSDDDAELYDIAKQIVMSSKKASVSNLQRKLKIGYNRAARLMDQMEEDGIVGPADGSKPRTVLRAGQ